MRRVYVNSLGSSDKSNVFPAFDGSLLSTYFSGEVEFFVENISSIRREMPNGSIGRILLEEPWITTTSLAAGSDIELSVLVSLELNKQMPVASAFLYVNSTNTIPGTATVEITSGISGSNLTWDYDIGAPNATRYFWVELVDDNANSSITPLGSYVTEDNTPPVVATSTMALGTPATTAIDLSFSATDNDAVETIYVWLSTSQTTVPTAAEIKASGQALAGSATSLAKTGLTPATTYYAYIMAKDMVGNESAVQAFTPASLTTNADTTPPTVDSFTLSAGTDAETQVSISLTISDTA